MISLIHTMWPFFLTYFRFDGLSRNIVRFSNTGFSYRIHSVLGFMFVHQNNRNCQCLNDLRVRIYDLGTLTTWL